MKSFFLLIFPALLLFPACMMMHTGSGGMHGAHQDHSLSDHHKLHVMDDNFHVDIEVYYSEPRLFTFTITEAATGNPARTITGELSVSAANVSSVLKNDIPDAGRYTSVIRLPADLKDNITLQLNIGDEQGKQSNYDFSIGQDMHSNQQHGKQGLNVTTTTVLVGAGMGLMMIGMMLFRWF